MGALQWSGAPPEVVKNATQMGANEQNIKVGDILTFTVNGKEHGARHVVTALKVERDAKDHVSTVEVSTLDLHGERFLARATSKADWLRNTWRVSSQSNIFYYYAAMRAWSPHIARPSARDESYSENTPFKPGEVLGKQPVRIYTSVLFADVKIVLPLINLEKPVLEGPGKTSKDGFEITVRTATQQLLLKQKSQGKDGVFVWSLHTAGGAALFTAADLLVFLA